MTKNQVTFDDIFNYAESLASNYVPPLPPVEWIEKHFIDPISKKLMVLEPYQRRIIRRALQVDDEGYSKYNLIIWSQLKKSGKTTVAGAVGAYVACNIEAPNEVSCVANDQEQAAGRIYAQLLPTLKSLGWKGTDTAAPSTYGPNGSFVKAITTRYEKEAGANQGLSLWSELWAYKGERLNRLWEEMTPPPTRRFRIRWVETYAGFKNESLLLRKLYLKIFKDDTEKELREGVVKLWRDLPVYEILDEGILVFWDHIPRMSWQTEKYYREQKGTIRPQSFVRLHENRWVDTSESFLTMEMWENSVRLYNALLIRKLSGKHEALDKLLYGPATYAIDGSVNDDSTSLIGTVSSKDLEIVITVECKIWTPDMFSDGEIDQEVLMNYILKLYKSGKLRPPLWYDPHQLVKFAQDLKKKHVPCRPFTQQSVRIDADTFLYKLYATGKVANPNIASLKTHVVGATVKKYDNERIRIIKPQISGEQKKVKDNHDSAITIGKVDAAVSQSMSAFKVYMRSGAGWSFSGEDD